MTEREEMMAAAALRVFARYGTRRTTMSDIAEEAGVVRQTLYNVFPSKGAVIAAAILHFATQQRREGIAAWHAAETLSDQLDSLFHYSTVKPWRDWQKLPDILDLESSDSALAQQAMSEAMAETRASLTELLQPYAGQLQASGQTPESLAQFMESALHGIKKSATDETVLMAQLATFKATLLPFLGGAAL